MHRPTRRRVLAPLVAALTLAASSMLVTTPSASATTGPAVASVTTEILVTDVAWSTWWSEAQCPGSAAIWSTGAEWTGRITFADGSHISGLFFWQYPLFDYVCDEAWQTAEIPHRAPSYHNDDAVVGNGFNNGEALVRLCQSVDWSDCEEDYTLRLRRGTGPVSYTRHGDVISLAAPLTYQVFPHNTVTASHSGTMTVHFTLAGSLDVGFATVGSAECVAGAAVRSC